MAPAQVTEGTLTGAVLAGAQPRRRRHQRRAVARRDLPLHGRDAGRRRHPARARRPRRAQSRQARATRSTPSVQAPLRRPGDLPLPRSTTDSQGAVYEGAFEDNNVGATISATEIQPTPAPDLAVQARERSRPIWSPAAAGDGHLDRRQHRRGGRDRQLGRPRLPLHRRHARPARRCSRACMRSQPVAAGASYPGTATVTLPNVADGSYRFVVVSDATQQVYEHAREANNTDASTAFAVGAPEPRGDRGRRCRRRRTSGGPIGIQWRVTNIGSSDVVGTWIDRVYLSPTPRSAAATACSASSRGPGRWRRRRELPRHGIDRPAGRRSPATGGSSSGVDATGAVHEANGETDNEASAPIDDRARAVRRPRVDGVTAPTQLIADPARVTVGWTVTNHGTGAGLTSSLDRPRRALARRDRRQRRRRRHRPLRARRRAGRAGPSYSRSETMFAPPAATGRFTRVRASPTPSGVVFENGAETDNVGAAAGVRST